ncbi:MAG: biotin--[acetyl-CoA-carboxylase] ligase [Desulfobacteraceae bacterium]|nr:MAG: biotin--[acetyl-CoA-carboxylase] ligase [Desulfobacteraceae bacterium]
MVSLKKELLLTLKNKPGEWVSGESVSAKLQVTRSAIWKHVQKLRDQGYEIQSAPKLGYMLLKWPEKTNPDEIRTGLQTEIFGQTELIYLPETDSTNRVAKDLALKNAPEGTLVIAEKQTQGRGRLGRQWFSPADEGVYISLIIRPAIPPQEAPKLTLLTAVAIADAIIDLTGLPIHIKWPNDILINAKKTAGILTEINSEMDRVNYIVVGLGLNVNTPSFPDEIKDLATSLFLETGQKWSRLKVVQAYLHWFEKYYTLFTQSGFSPVLKRWKELTRMIGKSISVVMLNEQYRGVVQDIDSDGALIIKNPNGNIQRIICGDVTILKGVYS